MRSHPQTGHHPIMLLASQEKRLCSLNHLKKISRISRLAISFWSCVSWMVRWHHSCQRWALRRERCDLRWRINPSYIFLKHFGIPRIAFGKKCCKMKSTKREPLNAEAQPNHFHWQSQKPTCKLHLDPTGFWEFREAHSKHVTPSAISSETVKGLPPFQVQIGASDTRTQSDLELP